MQDKKTIQDTKCKNCNVLVRTDYNVPTENGKIVDNLRIKASLPTLKYLIENGAKKIIVISHLGRPEGTRKPELSLEPVAKELQKLLPETPVNFVDDVSGPDVEMAAKKLPKGGILLLENLRFFSGEESNSEYFVREIVDSVHANLFVQDGFAVVHRAHASTDAITKLIPSVAGLLVKKEVETLSKVLEAPKKPLMVVIGGAKVEDKQPLIEVFAKTADQIVVGGKIAADGYRTDKDNIYVAEDFDEDASGTKLDVGPVATAKICELISSAKTVIWNGVLGKVEYPAYATSSVALATCLGQNSEITSVICGGDTTAFVNELAKTRSLDFSLVSTGGGAALEFLCGKDLPGIDGLWSK